MDLNKIIEMRLQNILKIIYEKCIKICIETKICIEKKYN